MRVELRSSPGCPNAPAARRLVEDCLAAVGIAEPLLERVGGYPSPTVLVDGADVMRPAEAPSGEQCRLDLPTRERVLAALQAAAASS